VSLSYQFATFEYFSIKEWPDQTIHALLFDQNLTQILCENSGSADYLKALSKNPLKNIHHICVQNMVRMLSNNLLGLQLNDDLTQLGLPIQNLA
jgi:hypothetical protein